MTRTRRQGLFSSLDPEKLVGMDNYGPMYEQLYRGKCCSLVTGVNEYLIFAQVVPRGP